MREAVGCLDGVWSVELLCFSVCCCLCWCFKFACGHLQFSDHAINGPVKCLANTVPMGNPTLHTYIAAQDGPPTLWQEHGRRRQSVKLRYQVVKVI